MAQSQPVQPQPSQVQQVPSLVYVNFSAEIIPHTTESLIATCANLANQGVKTIYLLLSTPGGSVMHGMTLYNVLRCLPVELIPHNVGNVDSIGNVVFLAGKKRYACKNSTFMFHGVGFDGVANVRLEEKLLRERLDSITSDQKRIGEIIAERTKINPEQVAKLFLEAKTQDVTFAASNGIIDDIRDVQISPGQPVVSLVFQRQGVQV
ncbi:MAG: ATP-dependent Clp protease proteolytic subunit [Candidatus Omnitrophica bacterium]|nr:ATP-dependent Clp protease proteolytic subunit [Candidatus Omnitrophota bacterium]